MQIPVTTHFYFQAEVTIPGGLNPIIYALPFEGLFTSTDLSWLFKEIQHQKGNDLFAGKESSRCTEVPEQYIYFPF